MIGPVGFMAGPGRSYAADDPDQMDLPNGLTCGDCFHINRCKLMFGHVETDTRCDWSPSRFRPARATEKDTPA